MTENISTTRLIQLCIEDLDSAQKAMLSNETESNSDRRSANEVRIARALVDAEKKLREVLRRHAEQVPVSPFAPRGEA